VHEKQIICLLIACFASASLEAQTIASLSSPNKLIEVKLIQSPDKQIQYQVFHKSKEAIAPSTLGFTLKNHWPSSGNSPSFASILHLLTKPGHLSSAK